MKQGTGKTTHQGKEPHVYHKGHAGAASQLGAEQVYLHGKEPSLTTKAGSDSPKSTTTGHRSGSQGRH